MDCIFSVAAKTHNKFRPTIADSTVSSMLTSKLPDLLKSILFEVRRSHEKKRTAAREDQDTTTTSDGMNDIRITITTAAQCNIVQTGIVPHIS